MCYSSSLEHICGVPQRANSSPACLNILLPVWAIYNVVSMGQSQLSVICTCRSSFALVWVGTQWIVWSLLVHTFWQTPWWVRPLCWFCCGLRCNIQEESSWIHMILPIALTGLYILSMVFCEWPVCVHVWCGPILSKWHLDLGGWKLTCSTELLLLTEGCSLRPCLSLGLQMSSLPQFAQLSKYLKLYKLIIS